MPTDETLAAVAIDRAQLVAVEDFINGPWRGAGDIEPMEVRDYRHELYRVWTPLCRSILAALSGPSSSRRDEVLEAQVLADLELHLQSSRIFLTSREKMHPCGVAIHDELQAKLTAAVNALKSQPPSIVGEDATAGEFVMVPREPTREMLRDARAATEVFDPKETSVEKYNEVAWSAMIAAAPKPTQPSIGMDEREKIARIVKGARLSAAFGREFRAGDGRLDDVDLDAADAITALTTSPARDQGEQTVVGIIERKNATILALEADLAEAVKALKPFADAGEYLDLETDGFMPGDKLHVAHEDHIIFEGLRFGDFEVARATLSRLTGGE